MAKSKEVQPKDNFTIHRQQETLPTFLGVWVRMVKKGNGFQVEKLHVTPSGMVLEPVGDWDLRAVTEQKALTELVKGTK